MQGAGIAAPERTTVMKKIALVLVLVLALMAFCGYSPSAPGAAKSGTDIAVSGNQGDPAATVPAGMKEYTDGNIRLYYPEDYTTTENSFQKYGAKTIFTGMVPDGSNDTFAVATVENSAYDVSAATQDSVIADVQKKFPFAFAEFAEDLKVTPTAFDNKGGKVVCTFNVTALFGEIDVIEYPKLKIPVNVDYTYVIVPAGGKTYYCSFLSCPDYGSKGIDAAFGQVIASIKAVT